MGIISWTIWGLLVGFIAAGLGFADPDRFDFSSLFGAVVTSVVLLVAFMRFRARSGGR